MKYTVIIENIGNVATKISKKDVYNLCLHYIQTKPEQTIDVLEESNNSINEVYTGKSLRDKESEKM